MYRKRHCRSSHANVSGVMTSRDLLRSQREISTCSELDPWTQLTGEQAKAKEYLDTRSSRTRNVRELAIRVLRLALMKSIRHRIKNALARFPDDLPHEFEEPAPIANSQSR